ncbi:hypothetical protein AAVH_38277, partial [Aphelenchoides avenae]
MEWDYYTEALRVTTKLLNSRIDDSELAVLTVVLLDISTRKLVWHGENPIAPLMTAAFRNLAEHCAENYKDYAVRLDHLIQLAHDFE